MYRFLVIPLTAAALAVAAFFSLATYILWQARPMVLGVAYNASLTAYNANETLKVVNAPCAGNQPCRGTLGLLNKTVVKIGDAIVQTQLTERNATPHVIAAMDSLNLSAKQLGEGANSLSKTANAATELTVALTSATGTANQTIASAQPVLASFQRSGDDLDSLLRSKAIYDTLDSTAATSEHIAGITGDLKIETDALVRPKTRKEKILGWMPTGVKLGMVAACIATGTTCP